MNKTLSSIAVIAYRDFMKFLRHKERIIGTFIFPVLFIGLLGTTFQRGLGQDISFNFLVFVFTGVFGQTLFQSTATGIISLIDDRKTDFSQEMFISPVSRYVIILGKIVGETLVSLVQAIGIIVFGVVIGVNITFAMVPLLLLAGIIVCLFGGAFGLLVLANLSSERSANQIWPFIIFPQFFLAGVFNPVNNLPFVLDIASRLAPMRYAVDFIRNVYYIGSPEAVHVVQEPIWVNLAVMAVLFVVFLISGTYLFVRREREK